MIIVSACLVGLNCKYNGGSNYNEKIAKLVKEKKAIPVCPEQLGGLSTPRTPAEIIRGSGEDVLAGKARVKTKDGEDVTDRFIKGARETLKVAELAGCKKAVFKAKSPSCGYGKIYNGRFTNSLIKGNGVAAALLEKHGIKIYTEESI